MGTFKYREHAGAPWQELLTIGNIYTQGVRPPENGGFSTDTHEVMIINNSPRVSGSDQTKYSWGDYENYISNLDDVELLIMFDATATYFYCKGLMTATGETNTLPCMVTSYNTSNTRNTIDSQPGSKFRFYPSLGVRLEYQPGSFYTGASYTSIYCVVKKGAA